MSLTLKQAVVLKKADNRSALCLRECTLGRTIWMLPLLLSMSTTVAPKAAMVGAPTSRTGLILAHNIGKKPRRVLVAKRPAAIKHSEDRELTLSPRTGDRCQVGKLDQEGRVETIAPRKRGILQVPNGPIDLIVRR